MYETRAFMKWYETKDFTDANVIGLEECLNNLSEDWILQFGEYDGTNYPGEGNDGAGSE